MNRPLVTSHGATKKIPREVWMVERDYLSPLPNEMFQENTPVILRRVRKDNTILYGSNRYSVPHWLYGTGSDVEIETTDDGRLVISLPCGDVVCEHTLLAGKGGLRKNTDHCRDKEKSVNELQESVSALLMGEADDFLAAIREEKRRYARDQFKLIEKSVEDYGVGRVIAGIGYCMENRMYSATSLKSYLENSAPQPSRVKPPQEATPKRIPRSGMKFHVKTEKRPIGEYSGIGGAL